MAPFSHQPAIIVQRKSRGYKGILLVMLTVFLIALFALTISEIAYNRQRDDNFLKLRWAELKHRMGYTPSEQGPFNMFQRTFFRPVTNDEVPQAQAQQISERFKKFNQFFTKLFAFSFINLVEKKKDPIHSHNNSVLKMKSRLRCS